MQTNIKIVPQADQTLLKLKANDNLMLTNVKQHHNLRKRCWKKANANFMLTNVKKKKHHNLRKLCWKKANANLMLTNVKKTPWSEKT